MKKFILTIVSIIALMMLPILSFAESDPTLEISGSENGKANDTVSVVLKVQSDEKIGNISGKIELNESIEMLPMEDDEELAQVEGKNGWGPMVNINTGSFIITKASGGKSEDVVEIPLKIKSTATVNPKITISGIKLTGTTLVEGQYKTTQINNIEKTIILKTDEEEQGEDIGDIDNEPTNNKVLSSIEITKTPTKTKYKVGEKFDKSGMEVTAKYSDQTSSVITNYTYSPSTELKETDKSITISYTEGNVTKNVSQSITVEKTESQTQNTTNNTTKNTTTTNSTTNKTADNTVANKVISNAGKEKGVIFAILGCALFAIVFLGLYIGYKKYMKL